MYFDIWKVLAATIAQFVVAAIWYTPIFGKVWGQMHGFDKLPADVQQKMQKEMGPWLGLQFVMTFITSAVLGLFYASLPAEWHAFGMAGFFWLGFMMPVQVSAVVFGGTPKEWMWKKILISTGGSLLCMMTAAAVFHLMR